VGRCRFATRRPRGTAYLPFAKSRGTSCAIQSRPAGPPVGAAAGRPCLLCPFTPRASSWYSSGRSWATQALSASLAQYLRLDIGYSHDPGAWGTVFRQRSGSTSLHASGAPGSDDAGARSAGLDTSARVCRWVVRVARDPRHWCISRDPRSHALARYSTYRVRESRPRTGGALARRVPTSPPRSAGT